MSKNLVIFGAWYLADVVEELAAELGWRVLGRVDPDPPNQIQTLDHLPDSAACFVAIGDNQQRRYVSEQLQSRGHQLIKLIHPTAIISSSAQIGLGSYVGEYAVVRTQAWVGRGAIANAGIVVSHHSVICDFVTLGPNSAIASRGNVGTGSLIGVGACVKPACRIGENCKIGAGAVVVNDIISDTIVVGNPAKPLIRKVESEKESQSNWTSNSVW